MNLSRKQIPLPKEREHYVLENLKMVHFILQHRLGMKPYMDYYEDAYLEGVCQLIECARTYDEESGVKFSSYAFASVQGHIRRMKRDTLDYLRLSRSHYDALVKLNRLEDSEQHSLSELAELTGEKESMIADLIAYKTPYYMDMKVPGKEREMCTAGELIPAEDDGFEDKNFACETIYECIELVSKEFKGRAEQLSSETKSDIWEEYVYSRINGYTVSQDELASKYHVAQPTVARVLKQGKDKLKELLEANDITV